MTTAKKAKPKAEETLLSGLEVAQRFGLSGAALTRAVAADKIKTTVVAGRTFYSERDVTAVAGQGREKS